ncbi:TetR/AcrR family transcriptional regulator [Neomicrococcus lactis]|uniref:TetR/AcrR family transcriptional regulator n=1 Tax=Neomicrococcus lactis TaxID=732241 RepID=UPI00230026AE|nr:TetR/AcrR family transcriptional regulator [Neomicrococcus lactis]
MNTSETPHLRPALELLERQGFHATSVDELAAALGMSRSTFFRRYGTKEAVVFSDQEAIVAMAQQLILQVDPSATLGERLTVVRDVVLQIFERFTADRESAAIRYRLVREVEELKDRELVGTHRFERVFRTFLDTSKRDHDAAARATSVGFAAAVVAVHNDHFRRWLRDFSDDHRGELALAVDAVLARFMPATDPHVPAASGTGTDANKLYSAEEVLEIVRKALS